MKGNKCCCSGGVTTILACSGGSNVGQIINEVAKRLDMAGVGKFFCLAGVGGRVSGMVASVEGSDTVLVIDGCPAACAKKTMESAGLDKYRYVVVTDLGIEKVHDFRLSKEGVEHVISVCLAAVKGSLAVEVPSEA